MLLIGDGEAQVFVLHALGDQRVGADDYVPFTACDGLVGDAVLLLRQTPHQQARLHAQRLQQRLRALVVLAGQHLGGSHQRRLVAAAHRKIDRTEGHCRLAAAHVALHHAGHSVGCTHVACNLLQHALLRPGGRKGHLLPVLIQIGVLGRNLHALFTAVTAQRDGHLIQQQLLKGDAPPGRLQRLAAVREVGVAHGEVALAQAVAPADGLRQLVGPLALAHLQRRLHALPHGLGRNAADAAVHRNQARLLLDGGAAELNRAAPDLATPVEHQLPVAGQLILQPGLVVPHHRHGLAAVGDVHLGDHQLARAALADLSGHTHAHGDRLAGAHLAQRREGGEIAVVPGQEHHQIPHAADARRLEGLQARRPDAAYRRKGHVLHALVLPLHRFQRGCFKTTQCFEAVPA